MNSDAEVQRQRALIQQKLHEVAAETGYAKETVEWIYWVVVARSSAPHPKEGDRTGVSAETVCDQLIRQANDYSPGMLRAALEYNRLFRSENVGEIVTCLIDHDLLKREADDYFTDFDGIFDVENLGPYLASRGIRQRFMAPGAQRRLGLLLCAIGLGLTLARWLDFGSIPNDWIGPATWVSGCLLVFLSKRKVGPGTPRAD
jgi:uncharacterized repeat protein (TIGR04138 family)